MFIGMHFCHGCMLTHVYQSMHVKWVPCLPIFISVCMLPQLHAYMRFLHQWLSLELFIFILHLWSLYIFLLWSAQFLNFTVDGKKGHANIDGFFSRGAQVCKGWWCRVFMINYKFSSCWWIFLNLFLNLVVVLLYGQMENHLIMYHISN